MEPEPMVRGLRGPQSWPEMQGRVPGRRASRRLRGSQYAPHPPHPPSAIQVRDAPATPLLKQPPCT